MTPFSSQKKNVNLNQVAPFVSFYPDQQQADVDNNSIFTRTQQEKFGQVEVINSRVPKKGRQINPETEANSLLMIKKSIKDESLNGRSHNENFNYL